MSGEAQTQMPKYRCHKEVWALKIGDIQHHGDTATITPSDESYGPFDVHYDYIAKHNPQVGGYYVVYAPDGYQSFSPADVFEAGYTRL